MNQTDREKFEQWWKENMPNPDWLSSDHSTDVYKAWEAACAYKQEEIDVLKGMIKSAILVYEEQLESYRGKHDGRPPTVDGSQR